MDVFFGDVTFGSLSLAGWSPQSMLSCRRNCTHPSETPPMLSSIWPWVSCFWRPLSHTWGWMKCTGVRVARWALKLSAHTFTAGWETLLLL